MTVIDDKNIILYFLYRNNITDKHSHPALSTLGSTVIKINCARSYAFAIKLISDFD